MTITLDPGAGGSTLGTDTVSGIDYEIVKLGFSASGSAPVQVSLVNGLPVNLVAGGLPAIIDNASSNFTPGSSNGVAAFGLYLDSATVTSGRAAMPRISAARQLLVAPQGVVNGGGTLIPSIVCAAGTNGTLIKTGAGTLYSLTLTNTGSALAYLKIFDKVAPTLGTDTALMNIPIPFSASGGGICPDLGPVGASFVNGIYFAITAGESNTDATGLAASPHVIVNGVYS